MPEPILAHMEDVPTATLRTWVGTSSAEYMKTTLKPAEMKKRPTEERARFTHESSEEGQSVTHDCLNLMKKSKLHVFNKKVEKKSTSVVQINSPRMFRTPTA